VVAVDRYQRLKALGDEDGASSIGAYPGSAAGAADWLALDGGHLLIAAGTYVHGASDLMRGRTAPNDISDCACGVGSTYKLEFLLGTLLAIGVALTEQGYHIARISNGGCVSYLMYPRRPQGRSRSGGDGEVNLPSHRRTPLTRSYGSWKVDDEQDEGRSEDIHRGLSGYRESAGRQRNQALI